MSRLERAAMLLTLMRELQDVMKRENALLREMQIARLADLQATKSALAERFEAELQALRVAPHVLGELPTEARRELDFGMREFQRCAGANAAALRSSRDLLDALVRRIGDSLATLRPRNEGYGRSAAAPPSGQVVPVAFDRRV